MSVCVCVCVFSPDKGEELPASTYRSVHSHFSQGQTEGQVTLAVAFPIKYTAVWLDLVFATSGLVGNSKVGLFEAGF